jgi:hypothetical protein
MSHKLVTFILLLNFKIIRSKLECGEFLLIELLIYRFLSFDIKYLLKVFICLCGFRSGGQPHIVTGPAPSRLCQALLSFNVKTEYGWRYMYTGCFKKSSPLMDSLYAFKCKRFRNTRRTVTFGIPL